ncbi:MAG: ribose 5-phosphate isomerase A [Desulfurococcales archaeon]|nr:ribose 5-phosphate isomerase A [Desulfurococcales archaeon]
MCNPKRAAAKGALALIKELGAELQSIGIGTGSTVGWFVEESKDLIREATTVASSSLDTALKLARIGVGSVHPSTITRLDLYVDGADEVAGDGSLVKGRGAALLGEKILAYSSRLNIIIVDESKLVQTLGERKPIPIEVHKDALMTTLKTLDAMGLNPKLRSSTGKDGPVISDWGGVIIDLYTGPLTNVDPAKLEAELKSIPGVIEVGIFTGLTDYVVVGTRECEWRVMKFKRTRGLHLGD